MCKVHPVLGRCDDPRLPLAAEWDGLLQSGGGGAAAPGVAASAPAPAAPTIAAPILTAPKTARRDTPERDWSVRDYFCATTPCTWLASLLSASMARDSSWRCGSVTVSYSTNPSPLRNWPTTLRLANRWSTALPSSVLRSSTIGAPRTPPSGSPRRSPGSPTGRCG